MADVESLPSSSSSHNAPLFNGVKALETSGYGDQADGTFSDRDDDGHPKRTGTVLTASAHIITAVVGSGVLSLPWCMAQLGWIAGPAVLFTFALVTYYMSLLLADCYRSPDPVTGKRNYTYMDAVKANLGGLQIWLCGLVQYANLIGTCIGYTVTASISMVAIGRSDCFHQNGKQSPCHISNNPYMIFFGVVQIILSQIPDFNKLWWLSIVAAIMSFSYSLIGLGLSVARAVEGGHSFGTAGGVSIGEVSEAQKVWLVFQALGDIAFAYSFSMILIEVQDTLKSPPPENKSMKKATLLGVSTTTVFYMLSGCVGYAAFGNRAPGNILTGFGFYEPYWLVDLANACVVVHLVGAYQVFAQPVYAFVEHWIQERSSNSKLFYKDCKCQIPMYGMYSFNVFQLLWRSCFVIACTLVAMLLPFFNDIVGILGALGFWPLTVYFPVEMFIVQRHIRAWTRQWIALQSVSILCLIVSLAALVGSVEGVLQDLKMYKPFKTQY
ncbi:hypothetical protein L7F22_056664 [Adiantum nelumboides]|nr:hypothetical protein [Adiantum nelumboides]